MAHMHGNRNGGYGASYYESDQEVVRTSPCDSYSSEYRVQEYANPGYSTGYNNHHNHNNGGYASEVTEVMSYESNPGYGHHHHHGGATEVIEKREEFSYGNNARDPCNRRMY